MVKLTQLLKEDLIKRKEYLLKEEISRNEALTDVDSIRTLVDGKRGVAFITRGGNSSQEWEAIQNMVDTSNLKTMHVKGNEFDAYIVYVQGYANDATELKNIAEKYGGYLHVEATAAETRRIGELLGYKKDEIDAYIKKWYPRNINNEALDVDWNPFEENSNTWEKYKKLCAERMASHINLDDVFNVVQLGDWGEEIELGKMTAREALNRYIEECEESFNGDIGGMFEYWQEYANTDDNVEALVEDAVYMENPDLRTLSVGDELALELRPIKNDSNGLDEALDVSWNPYEETDNLWWYEEEGDGINWDSIMDTIKAAANKVVGDTAPNRNSYFNVWYDIIKEKTDQAWENWEWGDEDDDDDGVMDACRDEVKYYIDPQSWEDLKDVLVYKMEEYSNIVADKKTLANFQKMGVLIHKMLNSKHKSSISEALDVDWNPYEAWKDKYTDNSWLRVTIGSRGAFEGAEIEEIPNIEKYLLDKKEDDYKELLKDLKKNNADEEEIEEAISYFNEFCGPFRMNKDNPSQWGYGFGEEDHELYYKILSDKYNEWVENVVAVYGVDFADQLTYDDIQQLDKLDYEF
jgi:hypothetical protein